MFRRCSIELVVFSFCFSFFVLSQDDLFNLLISANYELNRIDSIFFFKVDSKYPPTPLPARGRRWGSVRLALERDCGSLLPSLSPSPVQPCTLPAFFLSLFSCSSSFLFFPFPFCCRRTPLVGARCRQTSAAWKSAGSEAFVAGRSLWTDSLLHIGLKRDVRHPAAAEQAAGALLWFVLAAAKRVRPPSALDAKLFLLVAPWGPITFYFLYRIQK